MKWGGERAPPSGRVHLHLRHVNLASRRESHTKVSRTNYPPRRRDAWAALGDASHWSRSPVETGQVPPLDVYSVDLRKA